jgi:Bacteriophage HK97-gp10, putative tail-component
MAADFSFAVTEWVNKAGARANELFRTIATDAVNRVKELTPVDTGFLRSNWTAILQGEAEPKAGDVQAPQSAVTISHARIGDVIIILNPTAYARRIEYGFVGEDSLGRHYNQQGHHMVAQTMSEMTSIANAAAARLGVG